MKNYLWIHIFTFIIVYLFFYDVIFSSNPFTISQRNDRFIYYDTIHNERLYFLVDSIRNSNHIVDSTNVFYYIELDKTSSIVDNSVYDAYSFSFLTEDLIDLEYGIRRVGVILLNRFSKVKYQDSKVFYPLDSVDISGTNDGEWVSYGIGYSKILYRATNRQTSDSAYKTFHRYYLFNGDTIKRIGQVNTDNTPRNIGDATGKYRYSHKYFIGSLRIDKTSPILENLRFYYKVDINQRDKSYKRIDLIDYYEEYIIENDTLVLNKIIDNDQWNSIFGD
jgi:hypothetical protein